MNEDFIIVHQSPASIEVISKVGTLTVSAPDSVGPKEFMNENVIVHEAPAPIEVISRVGTLTVSAPGPLGPRGFTGPTGPQGPAGVAGGLDSLDDVLLVNLQDGQLLRYSAPLQSWTNSNTVDGGNF